MLSHRRPSSPSMTASIAAGRHPDRLPVAWPTCVPADAVPSSSQHQPTLAQPPAPLQPLPEPTDGETYRPSDGWKPRPHHLSKAQLWHRIRDEAALDAFFEPALATHLHRSVQLAKPSRTSRTAASIEWPCLPPPRNTLTQGRAAAAASELSASRPLWSAPGSTSARHPHRVVQQAAAVAKPCSSQDARWQDWWCVGAGLCLLAVSSSVTRAWKLRLLSSWRTS